MLADKRFHLPSNIAIVDATECAVQRPKKTKKLLSGKKKHHTLKIRLVISENRILSTNYAKGSVHDFQLFKLIRLPLTKNTLLIADTGYLVIEKIHKKNLISKKSSKVIPMLQC